MKRIHAVIHWPVAFPPGRGFFPAHPSLEGEVEIDPETSLVDTWKAVIALLKTGKVIQLVDSVLLRGVKSRGTG